MPGTGPALTALCLTSMQPRPPDLALVEFGTLTLTLTLTLTTIRLGFASPNPSPHPNQVEFGINANARDLPHFTALLRSLRDARVATVVVNVERYGSWRGCDR